MNGADPGLIDKGLELFKWVAAQFGLFGALTVAFVFYLIYMHNRTHNRLFKQMKSEIERLAEDNRAYRDKYLPSIGFHLIDTEKVESEPDTREKTDES